MSSEARPAAVISQEQYAIVVGRRQAFDAQIWQTPVLSLTAQAFLFSISLTAGNSRFAGIVAGGLSLITALASIQLMIKHRYHERRDSDLLQAFEKVNNLMEIHGRSNLTNQPWYVQWSSYKVWLLTLWVFAAAAVLVLWKTLCDATIS